MIQNDNMPKNERDWISYAQKLGGAAARAAADGYDVRPYVIEHIVAFLPKAWRIFKSSGPGGFSGIELEERAAPTAHAFEVMDAVAKGATRIGWLPGDCSVEIGRVSRATVHGIMAPSPLQNETAVGNKRTVIPVYVKSVHAGDTLVLVDAETA